MTRVLRKAHRRQGYTTEHFYELLHGHPRISGGFKYDHIETAAIYAQARGDTPEQAVEHHRVLDVVRAEMQQLWQDSREWLLGEWLDDNDGDADEGPGKCTRPWAWWEFDAPEARRQINDVPPNSTMADDYEYPGRGRLFYGVPRSLACREDGDCVYELQGEYLERLGLFMPGEQRYWNKHKSAWLAAVAAEGMDTDNE